MFNREILRAKVLPALRTRLRDRRRASGSSEGLSTVYDLLDVLAGDGVELGLMQGPWHPGAASPARRGRGPTRRRPYVERGRVQVYVESENQACKLAGFLNWCEVEEEDLA